MFKRANFLAKYRQYTKSLKSIQAPKNSINSLENVGKQCEKLNDTVKNFISKNSRLSSCRAVLSVAHRKINEKVDKTKEHCAGRLQSTRFAKFAFRAAAFTPLTRAETAPSTGYSNYDSEILKQLGVLPTDNTTKTDFSSASATNSIFVTNEQPASNAFSAFSDSQNAYPSIFDTLPEEKNDLYTLLTNTFNFTNDQTTQTTEIASTNENNNYLVIETPGQVEPVANFVETPLTEANIVIEAIPEPPIAPEVIDAAANLGETFASLGLGGWTPVGIVQNCFEYLHVGLGIPWWEAIAIGTLVIRFAMFPLVIMAQKNAARMNNHLPQMQVIQLKMTEARQSGNQKEAARYSQELMTFMKEKQLNPLKNMIVPLAQMPVFVSFFMGLRQMANVPVDSLRWGGLFWFSDLTVPDQFFALPIITSLTLWATIELGTDAARLNSQNLQTMKYVLRALPFIILPLTVNFPGAILCYWVSSNFISLAQVGFLKIPSVRDYFNIDPLLKHDPTKLPIKNKGFVGGIKDSWTNIKITKELEERRRLDELQFQRAGKGPLIKTYKYDPTKQVKTTKVPSKLAN